MCRGALTCVAKRQAHALPFDHEQHRATIDADSRASRRRLIALGLEHLKGDLVARLRAIGDVYTSRSNAAREYIRGEPGDKEVSEWLYEVTSSVRAAANALEAQLRVATATAGPQKASTFPI